MVPLEKTSLRQPTLNLSNSAGVQGRGGVCASTAPCTSRRMRCTTQCASYCAPCQPLVRAFFGWIRSPPPTNPKIIDLHLLHAVRYRECPAIHSVFWLRIISILRVTHHQYTNIYEAKTLNVLASYISIPLPENSLSQPTLSRSHSAGVQDSGGV